MSKFQITVGDTQKPIGRTLKYASGTPVDVSSLTVAFSLYDASGTAIVTAGSVTKHPTFTFTGDTTNNWLACNDHIAQDGDQIVVSSTTTLPSGLAASTRYFVRERQPNSFKVSLTPDGPLITIASAGTGTHSFYVVGSVSYAFASGDVDTAGYFHGWFTTTDGDSKPQRFPNDGVGIPVEIKAVP